MKKYIFMIIIFCVIVYALYYLQRKRQEYKYEITADIFLNIPIGSELSAVNLKDAWGRNLHVVNTNANEFILYSLGANIKSDKDDIVMKRIYSPSMEIYKNTTDSEEAVSLSENLSYSFGGKHMIWVNDNYMD